MERASRRRGGGRVIRVMLLAFLAIALVWTGNLAYISRNDEAKGFFDCGTHCSRDQNVAGLIFFWGGALLVLLLVLVVVSALVRFRRGAGAGA